MVEKQKTKYQQIFELECHMNNITYEYHFKSNVGRAFIDDRKILVSIPTNRDRLFIALHEIGHIVNGNISPRYKEELEAEKFAIQKMKEYEISLSKKARDRSKRYIAICLQKAIHRGAKNLDKSVTNYIKKEYPETAQGKRRFI